MLDLTKSAVSLICEVADLLLFVRDAFLDRLEEPHKPRVPIPPT
jgi:hypothetical protein